MAQQNQVTVELSITVTPFSATLSTPNVTPVSEEKPNTDHFPFLTKKCYEEHRVELVEAEIRAACKGTAEALWRALWSNENLGYVEVEPYDAMTLYRGIEKWYGQLPYNERNFRKARNKR